MVSIVSFLFGGDFSTICLWRSMKVEPLLANNLRRLITESSLKLATARSACSRSYLDMPMWPIINVRQLRNNRFKIPVQIFLRGLLLKWETVNFSCAFKNQQKHKSLVPKEVKQEFFDMLLSRSFC